MDKHFAVSGFVVNRENTKMLMVYHKKLNTWVIPGGHLEANELPHEGALREIREETGIDANVLDRGNTMYMFGESDKEHKLPTPYTTLYELIPGKGDSPAHVHIDLIYLCWADEKTPTKQEAEVNDVKWFTWKEILELDTFPSIKAFARTR